MTDARGKIQKFRMPMFLRARFDRDWEFYASRTIGNRMMHRQVLTDTEMMELSRKLPMWASDSLYRVSKYCLGMRYYSASQFTNPGACPVSFEIEKEGPRRRPWRVRGHAETLYSIFEAQKASDPQRYVRFMDIVGPNGLKLIDKLVSRK